MSPINDVGFKFNGSARGALPNLLTSARLAGVSVSQVARRYDACAKQIFNWLEGTAASVQVNAPNFSFRKHL
jgi:hypothetical protein